MLDREEYRRYGRQLLIPKIGLSGQQYLCNSSVLIIGVGGLGCPASTYLAGAGVGKIGLVDDDLVDCSNKHRQFLHTVTGMLKVQSAIQYLKELNDRVEYVGYECRLRSDNAVEIFSGYDLVLDCTDGPQQRYLISDTAVALKIPLISGSALQLSGQLLLLDTLNGPCYRCIFPSPPPPHLIQSCGDGGILGPVVGVIGVLQAVEAIKLITKLSKTTDDKRLLIYDALASPCFRSIRMRGRKDDCLACNGLLTAEDITSGKYDYSEFCGSISLVSIPNEWRLEPKDFKDASSNGLLVDVREASQFSLCSLPESENFPISSFNNAETLERIVTVANNRSVYCVCRRGNDSQAAVEKLRESGIAAFDLKGGLLNWSKNYPEFPEY